MHNMDVRDAIRKFLVTDLNAKWLVANESHV
jgi:hypothetical protein